MVHNVPECRILDVALCVIADCRQNISVCILDLELVLSLCQVAASESLGSADCVLSFCVVEVLERVTKLELITFVLIEECHSSSRFRFYSYYDQTLLVVMECCSDLEDSGIICHTVVSECSIIVRLCTFRDDLADCVIVLGIFYIAVLVLIHAVKVILDQVECNRILNIFLGVYFFNNVFECLIRTVEFEFEVSTVQDSSKQSLFCIQLQCAFCMVLVIEVVSFAVNDLDIELLYVRFDLFTRRCYSYAQSDLCRIIRKVCLSVIDLSDLVGEAILKILDPVDSDDDHILLGIIYGARCCLVVHNVPESRILDGLSGVVSIDHISVFDFGDLFAILAADDKLKFFVLRQAVGELLVAEDLLLAPCLVVVREYNVVCFGLSFHIQLGCIVCIDFHSHIDGLLRGFIICDADSCTDDLCCSVGSALKLFHVVVSDRDSL